MDLPTLCGGDCTSSADLVNVAPIAFYDNVEVVLKEEDWPDPDDVLGRHFIPATKAEGVLHEMRFTQDEADYTLSYWITTAPASFICDGGPGVYLYEHDNYRGRCTKFTQNSPNIAWSEVGNDRASSIRIVGCFVVKLYQHKDYKGVEEFFSSNDTNLNDNSIRTDRVTSLRIYSC